MKKTTMLSLTTLALTAVFSLTACGNTAASNAPAASTVSAGSAAPQAAAAVTPAGTVLLSVNPEIEMEYDDAGQVLALNALNGDGSAVLAWWLAGLQFDLYHMAGNFLLTLLLYTPLRRCLAGIAKRTGPF